MRTVPLPIVRQALPLLSLDRFEFLLWRMFKPAMPKDLKAIEPYEALQLALYEWMQHLGDYVSDDQQQRIMQRFEPWMRRHSHLHTGSDKVGSMPVTLLTMTERRYVTWTGWSYWYDFVRDVEYDEIREPAVTHIVCDIVALWRRLLTRIQEGEKNGG